jgi:hypothetical protein
MKGVRETDDSRAFFYCLEILCSTELLVKGDNFYRFFVVFFCVFFFWYVMLSSCMHCYDRNLSFVCNILY